MNLLVARYFGIGNEILFNLQVIGAASWHGNSPALLFMVRMFGILLITFQRYVTVCWPTNWIDSVISHLHPMILVIIHYTVPCILYSPAFIVGTTEFKDSVALFIINGPNHVQLLSIIVIIMFLISFVMIVFMYLSILKVIFITKKNGSSSSGRFVFQQSNYHREMRLAAHVFLLSLMSATIFLYYWNEYSMTRNPGNVENWTSLRAYYPILSSNFSYINPITLILLNKDIQKMMRHMIFGSKKPIPVTPQSLKVASTSIQMT
uniref:G_PROTEIN_RECEP_F1_2 domain-containing protein n=1 Tax=Caenorhabditis tropicalis TaxID=1561998 RepID=A0A1I7TH28_9PELO